MAKWGLTDFGCWHNYYIVLNYVKIMVDILCPHCEQEIAMDDDAYGDFECPYCGGEFEWNLPQQDLTREILPPKSLPKILVKIAGKTSLGVIIISGVVMIIVGIAGSTLSFSYIMDFDGQGSGLAGAGVIVVLGIALIACLLFVSLGLFGLALIITASTMLMS
ncbi:MAG: hypothetical protein VXW70_02175 [Candidatus Thermoplasmatota archaeon]|nr:hypothetical protein [Candidatus Thermoplasmatota archaeon]